MKRFALIIILSLVFSYTTSYTITAEDEDEELLLKEVIDFYDINIPLNLKSITVKSIPSSPGIEILGRATLDNLGRCIVEINPKTFLALDRLSTTLIHEIEVHCRQSIYLISINRENLEERAYRYNIENFDRLNVSEELREFYLQAYKKFDSTNKNWFFNWSSEIR